MIHSVANDTTNARPVIGHVLHRLYLAGAEVLAAALARCLSDEGLDFVFFCLDEVGPLGQSLADEGFEVVDLKRRPGVDLRVSRDLSAHCARLGVSLLHCHQYTPFFYGAMSRAWPTRFGPWIGRSPRILFTEHGRHYPDHPRRKRMLANRLLLRGGDRVTAVGQWVKQALVDNEGIAADRIEVIHNGIDPSQFQPSDAATRAAVRAELGVNADQPVIMQVARFHPVKDHATAIRALAEVVKARPDALLVLVGDGEERPAIERLAGDLGMTGHLRLLGVRDDVSRLIAGADVFLLSSLSEGISVTLLEAMGAGLPIVATDVGGNGEVVSDGETGLLSPRGDAAGLARNLIRLIDDQPLRDRMGRAGRDRLLRVFTEQRMHDGYASLYRDMLA